MEWNSDPHYTSSTETSDTDVAKWSREGSAAAAILFVIGKINEFPHGTQTLLQVRRSPLVQRIIGPVEDKVARRTGASWSNDLSCRRQDRVTAWCRLASAMHAWASAMIPAVYQGGAASAGAPMIATDNGIILAR